VVIAIEKPIEFAVKGTRHSEKSGSLILLFY